MAIPTPTPTPEGWDHTPPAAGRTHLIFFYRIGVGVGIGIGIEFGVPQIFG
jgi:hypothetical protein